MKQTDKTITTIHLSQSEYDSMKKVSMINCIGCDCDKCPLVIKLGSVKTCMSQQLGINLTQTRYTIDD